MSYEGQEICICKNGHLSRFDCWDVIEKCQHCDEEEFVFTGGIDETNGYPIEVSFRIYEEKKPVYCPTCGIGVVEPGIYRGERCKPYLLTFDNFYLVTLSE